MMERTVPQGEEARYISLIRPIVERIRKELDADLDVEKLKESALSGLVQAVRTHRTRQGTTRRHDVWYGIFNAVLNTLRNQTWESARKTAMLTYWQKANHFMAFYSGSAEGAIKRDTGAVILEMRSLLRYLTLICWFSFDATSQEGKLRAAGPLLRPTSIRNLRGIVAHLGNSDQSFIRDYYGRKSSLENASGDLSSRQSSANRTHWKILKKAAQLIQAQI